MLGDTIAAISTSAGEGALAVVRLSGPRAFPIADACFRGRRRPSEMASHTAAYGRIHDPEGCVVDRVLLTAMRGPRTFTGEDTVEVGCHGGRVGPARVLSGFLEAGARHAEPGEFTRRAVLHGRMNLAEAEGILELVRARTEAGHRAAVRQLEGEGTRILETVRKTLDLVRLHMECEIEFSEDVRPWSSERMREALGQAACGLETVRSRARAGRRFQEGASVAITGRPNVGKSTLFNRLVGEERVLVSEEPGTTRDAVAEWIVLGGMPVRVVDTAGTGSARTALERAAEAKSEAERRRAEKTVLVVDASGRPDRDERRRVEGPPAERPLLVLNKTDLGESSEMTDWVSSLESNGSLFRLSARTGDGVQVFAEAVGRCLSGEAGDGGALAASRRQIDIIEKTLILVNTAIGHIESGFLDLAAADVIESIDNIGDIAGKTPGEDILNRIFSDFCIGK